jgi:hypothetical protein
MTPEGKVKKKVSALLKKYGVWYVMPRGTTFGRSGIPDYICLIRGRLVAIEAKAGTNPPTALQRHEIASIVAQGGIAVVVNEQSLSFLETTLRWITSSIQSKTT